MLSVAQTSNCLYQREKLDVLNKFSHLANICMSDGSEIIIALNFIQRIDEMTRYNAANLRKQIRDLILILLIFMWCKTEE